MKHLALIIEHDPAIREEVIEIVRSLGHEFTAVRSQKEGLNFLREKTPSYIIAALLMPVDVNAKLHTPDNCLHFIHQAQKICTKPIIVTASCEFVMKGYGPKLMRAGAFDLIDRPEPTKGRSLSEAIRDALRGKKHHDTADFNFFNARSFTGGTLCLYKDRIELNGFVIVESEDIGMVEEFLRLLVIPTPTGRRQKYSLNKLVRLLDASSPAAIISMVCRLRRKIFVKFMRELNIKISLQQVIVNNHGRSGGYYLSENITVIDKTHEKVIFQGAPETVSYPDLTPRQIKIVEFVCLKHEITRAIAAQICHCSERTALRELTELKKKGVLEFLGHGPLGIWRLCPERRQMFCPVEESA